MLVDCQQIFCYCFLMFAQFLFPHCWEFRYTLGYTYNCERGSTRCVKSIIEQLGRVTDVIWDCPHLTRCGHTHVWRLAKIVSNWTETNKINTKFLWILVESHMILFDDCRCLVDSRRFPPSCAKWLKVMKSAVLHVLHFYLLISAFQAFSYLANDRSWRDLSIGIKIS